MHQFASRFRQRVPQSEGHAGRCCGNSDEMYVKKMKINVPPRKREALAAAIASSGNSKQEIQLKLDSAHAQVKVDPSLPKEAVGRQ